MSRYTRYTWDKTGFSSDNAISNAIRYMMQPTEIRQAEVAMVLGRGTGVFRNKLSNGTFSLGELAAIARMAGWQLQLVKDDDTIPLSYNDLCDETIKIRLERFLEIREQADQQAQALADTFDQMDPEVLKRAYKEYVAAHPEKFNHI